MIINILIIIYNNSNYMTKYFYVIIQQMALQKIYKTKKFWVSLFFQKKKLSAHVWVAILLTRM